MWTKGAPAMTAAATSVEELLALTEATLALPFHTDQPAAESITDTPTGTAIISFAAVRKADPVPVDPAATQIADLWRAHGYTVTRSTLTTDAGDGAILDAHNDAGDTLDCYLSPYCTLLSGESAPVPR